MNLTSIPASIILLVLTAYLCIYIYRKDTIEKEPLSLLALLFIAGMVSFVLAAFLENVLVGGIDHLFLPYMSFDGNGMKFYSSENIRIAHYISCAVMIACLEEIIRGLVLCLLTHKNKNFNYTFDGMVYAVILYLGFGLVEAFRYIESGGFGSVLLRAIACIPAHMFLGVIMGCFYTGWHKKSQDQVKNGGKGKRLPTYLLLPIVIHASYSFFNLYASHKGGFLYEIVSLVLCVIGILIIRTKAAKDTMIAMLICVVILSAVLHPMGLHADAQNDCAKKYNRFYYNQLTANGRGAYNRMMEEIPKGNINVSYTLAEYVLDWNEIWQGVHAFHMDNPKYFWMDGGCVEASYRGKDITLSCSTYDYWKQTFDKNAAKKKLDAAVKKIAAEARKKENRLLRIEYVHDYIINNCSYDHDRLKSSKKTIHDPFDDLIYSAYGCLVQKKAVCAGYAKAFQLVMAELGIECDYVKGVAGDPGDMEAHGWNCVTINDEKYWIDLTWDDYDQDGKNNDDIHTYCMQTTSRMEKDHKAKDSYTNLKQPVAKGTKLAYHTIHKYNLDKYSESKMDEILGKQKNRAMKEIHFNSSDAYKKALKAIKNGDYHGKALKNSFWYWQDPKYCNLIFTNRK